MFWGGAGSCGIHPSLCSGWGTRFVVRLLASAVLLVAYLFHPVHDFSVELLLNGDVGHGGGWGGSVPVLFAG